jgi:predicted DNA repair protein MutK
MPLLMLGGAYLSYEAAEKVVHALRPDDGHAAAERAVSEAARVRGAIQTDLILSAEIMAITLETVSESPSWTQALVLGGVGSVLTVVVYGAVALIVKADDIGLVLVVSRNGLVRALGRSLVAGVPVLLGVLSVVGTAAMAWVGGGIILHGLDALGWRQPAEFVHHLAAASGPGEWFVTAGMSGLLGLLIGTILIPLGWAVARTRR